MKGAEYERVICKQLSLWLTGGTSDDELWRSSQSGGRATVRHRKGKETKGHAGDVVATGKYGARLLKIVTLEIKRGYNKVANLHTILDLRDQTDAVQMYEDWMFQAHLASRRAGTDHWWLIHRRDGRNATIFMPYRLWNMLTGDTKMGRPDPFLQMSFTARRGKVRGRQKLKRRFFTVVGMQLDHFLETVTPDRLWEWLPKKGKR